MVLVYKKCHTLPYSLVFWKGYILKNLMLIQLILQDQKSQEQNGYSAK